MALQTKRSARNDTEPYCWKKHGRPTRSDRKPKREDFDKDVQEAAAVAIEALAPQEPQSQTDIDWVCLMARGEECTLPLVLEKHKDAWHIDSAATSAHEHSTRLSSLHTSLCLRSSADGDSSSALQSAGRCPAYYSQGCKWRHVNSATCSMYLVRILLVLCA